MLCHFLRHAIIIISDTEATKEKMKLAPVKKGTVRFYCNCTFLQCLYDANCIHWCTEPEVSKEKAMPEPSKKGKMNAIVFYRSTYSTCILWNGCHIRKIIESCTEVEAVEEKVKPTPTKKGTVLMLCVQEPIFFQ